MPLPDLNAMDTSADRSRSNRQRIKGRTGTTTPNKDDQRKEGRCYTCNKQGHLARNCPDKPKTRAPVKAKAAEIEESDDETTYQHGGKVTAKNWESYMRAGEDLPEEDKLVIIRKAAEWEQGQGNPEEDF